MNPIQFTLLALPPETAHNLAMSALGAARFLPGQVSPIAGAERRFLGKVLKNPVSLVSEFMALLGKLPTEAGPHIAKICNLLFKKRKFRFSSRHEFLRTAIAVF